MISFNWRFVHCRSRRPSASASTWSVTARTATPSSGWFSSNPVSTGWHVTTRPAQCCRQTGSTSPAPLRPSSHKMNSNSMTSLRSCLSSPYNEMNKRSSNLISGEFSVVFVGLGLHSSWYCGTAGLCPSYSARTPSCCRWFRQRFEILYIPQISLEIESSLHFTQKLNRISSLPTMTSVIIFAPKVRDVF